MNDADEFLDLFVEIEMWLRQEINAPDEHLGFSAMVRRVARKDQIVQQYKEELIQYARLRNLIVHERVDSEIIAEPTPIVIENLKKIRQYLIDPPKLIPAFLIKVKVRSKDDAISKAVSDMSKGSFSQLPILAGKKVVELLTSETIARWLASEIENGIVSIDETTIETALAFTEDKEHYCFLSRDSTFYDALEQFNQFAERGKSLDAILITHSGSKEQKLLGILTTYDIPRLLEGIGLDT